jgi:hypothetical protein
LRAPEQLEEVGGGEGEREIQRERGRERKRGRERERGRERWRERDTDRERERDRERESRGLGRYVPPMLRNVLWC